MGQAMVDIYEIIEGNYRKEYAQKHGIDSLMNCFDTAHWNDEESEKMYKKCLDNNTTWDTYLKTTKGAIK